MLTSGDVVDLDLGAPIGREAGFGHPAVVITAQRILRCDPAVVHVVPLTSTTRPFESEVVLEPDDANGLVVASAAQCQHLRSVSVHRVQTVARLHRDLRINMPGCALVLELLDELATLRAMRPGS